MQSFSQVLKGIGMFYVGRTLLGSHKDNIENSVLSIGLKQAKFTPFYTAAFFGSTTLLIFGLAFLSYGLGLVLFEGVSGRSDTSFFAGSVLTGLGLGIKLAIFFVIRQQEKKLMSLRRSMHKWKGILDVFVETFAAELKKEQKQIFHDLIETKEVQVALRRFEDVNYPSNDSHRLH